MQLGFEYENARSEGRRARFFGAQANLRTRWTAQARSPPTGDCGALIYGRCSMANQMSEYPHYIERPSRSKQPVHSTSKNPAYTLSDGFLAISFDNLGAGAHLALSIAATSHRSKHRRNHLKKHLPARAGHTRTRSAQNAPESTLPRPQAQQEQKASTPRRAAPKKPWKTRTSSSSSRPRASET